VSKVPALPRVEFEEVHPDSDGPRWHWRVVLYTTARNGVLGIGDVIWNHGDSQPRYYQHSVHESGLSHKLLYQIFLFMSRVRRRGNPHKSGEVAG